MRPGPGAVQPDPLMQGNTDLAGRGLQGGWAHLAGVAIMAVATPYWTELPRLAIGLSALIVAMTLWRLYLILSWRKGTEGKRWRLGYEVAIVVTSLSWGILISAGTAHFGVERWATTLLIIIGVGFSAGGFTALAPHFWLQGAYLVLMWTPVAITAFALGSGDNHAMAIMVLLFMAYSLTQARLLNQSYWSDWRRAVDLEQAKQAAEAASRAKSEFLANISHEIRTPMHGVLGMLSASLEGEIPPEQREMVETARSSAESLLTLLNDVLDFSKTEAGKLRLENISFDLREMVASTVKSFSAQAVAKGIALEVECEPGVPERAMGDPTRLRQILSNLIGNAIKFTEAGSVTVGLEIVETKGETALLRFPVRDTGIGIPPEKQALVFESFAQADGATTRKYGGTGLGLAICRKLAEVMGGRIYVASEVGHGSTFTLIAPLGRPPAARVAPPRRELGLTAAKGPALRILVAEDNAVNQRLAVRLLEKQGHAVSLAANGREAVERWASAPFDLILMDIQMPEMDGYAATEWIRTEEKKSGRHTPIIGVTANAIDGDREKCLAAGMDGYLAKPFKAVDLYAKIEDHLVPVDESAAQPGEEVGSADLAALKDHL